MNPDRIAGVLLTPASPDCSRALPPRTQSQAPDDPKPVEATKDAPTAKPAQSPTVSQKAPRIALVRVLDGDEARAAAEQFAAEVVADFERRRVDELERERAARPPRPVRTPLEAAVDDLRRLRARVGQDVFSRALAALRKGV